jgi:hypothetical protein
VNEDTSQAVKMLWSAGADRRRFSDYHGTILGEWTPSELLRLHEVDERLCMVCTKPEAAIVYAVQMGWPVFPVDPRTGVPALLSAHGDDDPAKRTCRGECGYEGHGVDDATTSVRQILSWWERDPDFSIGIPTGHPGTFDALRFGAAYSMCKAELPAVDHGVGPTIETEVGFDLLYRRSGLGSMRRITANVDFLGSGGFVVAPPSGIVRWYAPHNLPLREVPEPLEALLERVGGRRGEGTALAQRRVYEPDLIPDLAVSTRAVPTMDRARGLIAEVEKHPAGSRNDFLNKAAFRVGTWIALKMLSPEQGRECVRALHKAGLKCGLGEREVKATVKSGIRAGVARRGLPARSTGAVK